MLKIEEIKKIDKKHIALMDTSSISFMQSLQKKEIMLEKCNSRRNEQKTNSN